MIEIELPWPPSVNHYKTVGALIRTKSGKLYQKRVNSLETKRFYYEVWFKIRKECPNVFFSETISLELVLTLHPPDKRRRDIDNGLKVIFDSFVRGGLVADDSQIARLLVERKDIIRGGKVIVRLGAL